ncbi:MAG: sigma-70 family RNA polymerase sigma factor [Bryobacteraceae bacterium]|nr:sigma-70 family RNA polymerase sigma factor [Bryobacteraceae bacterium]
MNSEPNLAITGLLADWRSGDAEALEQLAPLVFAELRRLAQHFLSGEAAGHVLQPTALVNEAFLRLMQWQPGQWKDRAHFFGVSATLMRRVLVQYARENGMQKRGGNAIRVSLTGVDPAGVGGEGLGPHQDIGALDEALSQLENLAPRQARVVELRFFTGLTLEEVAEVMNLSESTVRREWRFARAWLRDRLAST